MSAAKVRFVAPLVGILALAAFAPASGAAEATVSPAPIPVVTGMNVGYGFAGSTVVTITGSGFEWGDQAYFGAVRAMSTKVIHGGSAVDAVVPSGQGTVVVRVANNDRQRSVAGERFLYLPVMNFQFDMITNRGLVMTVHCAVGPCHLTDTELGQIEYASFRTGGAYKSLAQRSRVNLRTGETKTFLLLFNKAGAKALSRGSHVRRVRSIVVLIDRVLGTEVFGFTLVHRAAGSSWEIRNPVSPVGFRWPGPTNGMVPATGWSYASAGRTAGVRS